MPAMQQLTSMRTCNKCHQSKPDSAFRLRKDRRPGARLPRCNKCINAARQARRKAAAEGRPYREPRRVVPARVVPVPVDSDSIEQAVCRRAAYRMLEWEVWDLCTRGQRRLGGDRSAWPGRPGKTAERELMDGAPWADWRRQVQLMRLTCQIADTLRTDTEQQAKEAA